jgi:iron complex transport system substrate-binding protein
MVAALGRLDDLVGRSHECDYPASVRSLPCCTATKFLPDGTSYEIDQRIKAILQEGLSVYRVDGPLLRRLAPDVILTQVQCEVCAVSFKDLEAVTADWLGSQPEVVSLNPQALADVWTDIGRVAAALDMAERGRALIGELQTRMEAVAQRVAGAATQPAVACVEWIDPLMASGNWMPELVTMAGGVNLFGTAGKHAPGLCWEDLCQADPEVILVLPCGFDLPRVRQEMPSLAGRPGWQALRAVQEHRVFLLEGNQFFNRPGPRLVESLEILVEILHPGLCAHGHEGTGWEKW